MYESKLGTQKERESTRIASAKLRRPILPRVEERIVQKKKRKEYLDNYQYHISLFHHKIYYYLLLQYF